MGESKWWYSKDGQRLGPVPLTVLHDLAASGDLQRDTLVWCEGMGDWLEVQYVKDLEHLFAGPPPLPENSQVTSKTCTSSGSGNKEKFAFQPVPAPEKIVGDNESTRTLLAADVRKKYITTLAKRYETIAWVAGFILTSVILAMLNLNINIWVFVVLIMVGTAAVPAVIEHLLEKKLIKTSDQLLQVLYYEYLKKKHYTKLAATVIGGVFVVVVAAIFIMSESARNKATEFLGEISSSAKCEVVADSAYEDAFIIDNQSDYGYTVKAKLKNSGEDGEVSVVVNLYTSEGDFQRKQKVQLKSGETRILFYQFSEPSINATNTRYKVGCK